MAHTSSPFPSPSTSFLQPSATSEMNGTLTLTADPGCKEDHGVLHIPFAVLYSVIFVLGLAGNLVALWVFFCVHSKKNSVRVFLINVAFADLLLVACLPFRILYHSLEDVWPLRPVTCKLVGTLFYMNMYISITLLGLISIDRYLKMHRGSGAQRRLRSTRGSHGLCAIVWIGAFTLTVPFLMPNSDDPADKCFQYKELHNAKWKAYINIFLVVLFWLVFISLVVSYGRIALRLLRTSQEKPDLPNTARYTRTAKKSFFVLFLFTLCFVPYHVVRIFYIATQITETTTCYWRNVADRANETALLLSALNSCLDPVMYFLLSSSVRKEVLRLMSSVLCVRRDLAASSGSSSTAEGDGRTGRSDRGHTSTVVIVGGKLKEEEEQTGTGHSNLVCEDSLRQ